MVEEEAEKSPIIVPSDSFPTHNGLGGGGPLQRPLGGGGKLWRAKEGEGDSQARKGLGALGKTFIGGQVSQGGKGCLPHLVKMALDFTEGRCVPGLLQHFTYIIWCTGGETEAYRN